MLGSWLRLWRCRPLLTAQFSLTIAVGMGAASALASLMLALGYVPLPFRDPGQLAEVWERSQSGIPLAVSGPDLSDFADQSRGVFASFGGFVGPMSVWFMDYRTATEFRVYIIQPNVFSDLGIRPILGRGVRPNDMAFSTNTTAPAWISYALWKNRYGGTASIIGTTIAIAQTATGLYETQVRVVGVLPSGVGLPVPFTEKLADIWVLLPYDISARSRESDVYFGLGRLRPGVTLDQAHAALTAVAERLARQYSFDRNRLPVVQSLEAITQEPARRTMGLLALGLGFVFLVGCVNLAILMGAEGRRRRRDIAVRAILGASRSRLLSEVAREKCALTLLSVGLGVLFAEWMLHILTVLVPTAGLGPPLLHTPPLNLGVLIGFAVFALIAALVWSVLLVRVANAPESSRVLASASSGLGYTGLSDSGRGSNRWQLVLLAAQAGLGICLLAAAALTARTYFVASSANLGPAPRNTVLLSVRPSDDKMLSDARTLEFNRQVLSRLGSLQGIRAIALADWFPPHGAPMSFVKRGEAPSDVREASLPVSISPGYFKALGIPILFGRYFDDADNKGGEPIAIISLDMAERNWPAAKQALGSEIAFGKGFKNHYNIVGVAANFTGYWSQKPVPTIYLPEAQSANSCCDVILQTASPRAVTALAQQALAGMAIPATISDVSTMEARWRATLTRPLARMASMLMLALLGLALSIQGVYAVTAATVAARKHELAVRAALGALPSRLAWNVTREFVIAVLVGAGFGVVASLNLRPLLQYWLGPVAAWDAGPIVVAVALLSLTAGAGCYFPARAAARANPAEVLREG